MYCACNSNGFGSSGNCSISSFCRETGLIRAHLHILLLLIGREHDIKSIYWELYFIPIIMRCRNRLENYTILYSKAITICFDKFQRVLAEKRFYEWAVSYFPCFIDELIWKMFGEIAPQSPTFNSIILLPNNHTTPRPAHQALVKAVKPTTSVYLYSKDAEKLS